MIAEERLATATALYFSLLFRTRVHDDNDEEFSSDEFAMTLLIGKLERHDRHRVPLYIERVVPAYLDFEFRKLFRLSRSTCGALVEEYERSHFYSAGFRGRPKITAEKTLLVALSYVGSQKTMYQIADRFDVSESTVHAAISRVLDFLDSISAQEISWPDRDERERNKSVFLKYVSRGTGLPDVVGAIDGCHVRIARPTESEQRYYNRKKFHSIILQGVCDADMMVTDVFIGIPGRAHDSRVLQDSFFYEEAVAKCEGGYLVGDAAYPLKVWLLPFYRHTTAKWGPWMAAFNYAHTRQRVVIEQAFGILKARFQRLYHMDVGSIKQAVQIVLASCVLHNMARRCGEIVEGLEVSDSGTDVSSTEPAEGDDAPTRSAAAFRDSIAQSLL